VAPRASRILSRDRAAHPLLPCLDPAEAPLPSG
jgi:hypothetical protein